MNSTTQATLDSLEAEGFDVSHLVAGIEKLEAERISQEQHEQELPLIKERVAAFWPADLPALPDDEPLDPESRAWNSHVLAEVAPGLVRIRPVGLLATAVGGLGRKLMEGAEIRVSVSAGRDLVVPLSQSCLKGDKVFACGLEYALSSRAARAFERLLVKFHAAETV